MTKDEVIAMRDAIISAQDESQTVEEAVAAITTAMGTIKNHEHVDGMEYGHTRPSWDEYYLSMVPQVGTRGTCNRGRSGCIIVKDNRILMSGYVGAPPGMEHCDDVGHEFQWWLDYDPCGPKGLNLEDMHRHCIRTIHAEANTIYYCARKGVAIEGATIYCTMTPCRRCAEAIVQSGIARVVTTKEYHRPGDAMKYFEAAGVELVTVGGVADYAS